MIFLHCAPARRAPFHLDGDDERILVGDRDGAEAQDQRSHGGPRRRRDLEEDAVVDLESEPKERAVEADEAAAAALHPDEIEAAI